MHRIKQKPTLGRYPSLSRQKTIRHKKIKKQTTTKKSNYLKIQSPYTTTSLVNNSIADSSDSVNIASKPSTIIKADNVNTFSAEKTLLTTPQLFSYLDKYGRKHYPAVQALRQSTLDKRQHAIGLMLEPTTCSYLEHQLRLNNGLRVLEVGVFTGVTSLALTLNVIDNYYKTLSKCQQEKKQDIGLPNILNGIAKTLTLEQIEKIKKSAKITDDDYVVTDIDVMLYDSTLTLSYVTGQQKLYNNNNNNNNIPLPLVFGIDLDNYTIKDVALEHFHYKQQQQTNNTLIGSPYVFLAGNAKDIMKQLASNPLYQNTFDMIFIDADKGNYQLYYETALQLVKPQSGLIMLDNVLWKGNVTKYIDHENNDIDLLNNITESQQLDQQTKEEKQNIKKNKSIKPIKRDRFELNTLALHQVNAFIAQDSRTDSIILPIGDGLTIARKL